jgi:hypothetical protein
MVHLLPSVILKDAKTSGCYFYQVSTLSGFGKTALPQFQRLTVETDHGRAGARAKS